MNGTRIVLLTVAAAMLLGVAASAGTTLPCRSHPLAGKRLPAWSEGEFQVHFIYTGVAESMFWIFPDGTSMLLDCGDHQAIERGRNAVWVLPDASRHAGEWVARYVERVNPHVPDERCDDECLPHIKDTIAYLGERDGLTMERFRVGAVNQASMRHDAVAYPQFSIINITGNVTELHPSRRPDLWIHHCRCWERETGPGAAHLRPELTVVAHLHEMQHARGCSRWMFADGDAAKADSEKNGVPAVIPFWGIE